MRNNKRKMCMKKQTKKGIVFEIKNDFKQRKFFEDNGGEENSKTKKVY